MTTFSFRGSDLERLTFAEAMKEEGFLLVDPRKIYVGTLLPGDKLATVEADHSFWNESLWRSYEDGDEEVDQRFYFFDRVTDEEEMKREIQYGKESISSDEVWALLQILQRDGLRMVKPQVDADKATKMTPVEEKVPSDKPTQLTRRVFYNLYDFDALPRREAFEKMSRYAAEGFLDPHSDFLLKSHRVRDNYLSGKFPLKIETLTYTDNVLLNSLQANEFVSYGAIVPSALAGEVEQHVPKDYSSYFLRGQTERVSIDYLLEEDLEELIRHYNKFALWWDNPVFVSELERKYALPVTGDVRDLMKNYGLREGGESNAEVVNTLLKAGVPFTPEQFNFQIEDLNLRECISPVSLRIALQIIQADERLDNRARLDSLAQLLEIPGYYRYEMVNGAIPDYVKEDADADVWRNYLLTVLKFGDQETILMALTEYQYFFEQFEQEELVELFMKRGLTLYNAFVGNFSEMFSKKVGEISNIVLARALPYLDDPETFNTYLNDKDYGFLFEPEYAQALLESAASVSRNSLLYFLEKLSVVTVDKAKVYTTALANGASGALSLLISAFGPTQLELNFDKEEGLERITLLAENGFDLNREALIDYLCTRYRGLESIAILDGIGADFETAIRRCLTAGNKLLAIGLGLNTE